MKTHSRIYNSYAALRVKSRIGCKKKKTKKNLLESFFINLLRFQLKLKLTFM